MSMHVWHVCMQTDRNSVCGSWSLATSKHILIVRSVSLRTVCYYVLFKYNIHILFTLLNNICFS